MSACDDCLRRADLIAALAGWLDIEWRKREAPSRVLALADEVLLEASEDVRVRRRYDGFDPGAARERLRDAGLLAVCRCEPSYPGPLRDLTDPPAVLHVAGDLACVGLPDAVAIVGARQATDYGLAVARDLGRGISSASVSVVSGLALGVDSAAHAGALEGAAPPVAVLAGGAERPYPASKRQLYAAVRAAGAVVSEMPPGVGIHRWAFVARNRLIAALARVVVVVEATERSGSLTTADFAQQLGRPVGAVPGPVTSRFSAGTNMLLASGACVVRDTRDVLDQLLGPAAPAPEELRPPVPIEPRLRRLLDAVERGHGSLAELTSDPEATRQVLQDLTDLELRGLVRREFGGRYVRALEGRR